MNTAEWTMRIEDAIRDLADREYQSRTWFGHDPHLISSPVEMCCALCDDFKFPEFLADSGIGWTNDLRAAGRQMLEAIDACSVTACDPATVLDHAEWVRVRSVAIRLHAMLRSS